MLAFVEEGKYSDPILPHSISFPHNQLLTMSARAFIIVVATPEVHQNRQRQRAATRFRELTE